MAAGVFGQGTFKPTAPGAFGASAEAERVRRLRQRAAQQAGALPGVIMEEGQAALAGGQAALRSRAAAALGAGLAAGGVQGGAALAQARQSSLDVGAAEAALLSQQDFRSRAATAALEGTQLEAEMGSEQQDANAEIASIEPRIQEIKELHTHVYGNDGSAARRDIAALMQTTSNPVVREYIERRSQEVKSELGTTGGMF